MIKVTNRFEGANPSGAGEVQRVGDAEFVIRPYSEDGDGNYKFALLVRVSNRSDAPAEAEFAIDWADEEYMSCRDYVLLGRREKWRYYPAQVQGATARARVVVPPGRHELVLHPTYGPERLGALQRRAEKDDLLSVRELGRTGQGRPILAFELGDEGAAPADRMAIIARFHPYETAGSFAAEGALRELLRRARAGGLTGRRVSVVPIANVDGVAGGLCKRIAPGGPDMSHQARSADDAGVAALRAWLDDLRPGLMLDFHGWMYRYQDGFDYTHPALTEAVKRALLDSGDADRAWKGSDLSGRGPTESLWSWALERHGTASLIFSFGWYGRTVGHVRRIGAAVVSAVAELSP